DSLYRPRGDELPRARRQAAPRRGQGEAGDADDEHPPPAVAVAERAAHQQQRGEEERVRLDNPLHLRHRGAELFLQSRQGDVDRRAVDEAHAGAEDGGGQDPGLSRPRARRRGRCGADHAFVAGGFEDSHGSTIIAPPALPLTPPCPLSPTALPTPRERGGLEKEAFAGERQSVIVLVCPCLSVSVLSNLSPPPRHSSPSRARWSPPWT